MKKLFTLLLLVSFSIPLISQDCLPDGITFSTQQEIDDFAVNYPDCTHILGDVEIDDGAYGTGDIFNLNGLHNIDTIDGNLTIRLTELTNPIGLENLSSIGGHFDIYTNVNLTSLNGLTNLTSVEGHFFITHNNTLTSLSGLENLSSLGGSLRIDLNYDLASLSALNNLSSIGGEVHIFNNSSLSLCNIPFICNNLSQIVSEYFYNNASGCNNLFEISGDCAGQAVCIHYPLFYDLNANALLDIGEPYLPQASVTINPGNISAFSNTYYGGQYFLDYGTYNIAYNQTYSPNWQITTGISSYSFTLDEINRRDTIFFGLIPIDSISDIRTSLISGIMRCNETVLLTATAYNDGTLPAQGMLWLEVDENITNVQYLDIPDTIVLPNRYGWHYDSLYPGNSIIKKINLGIPGPSAFQIGDLLHFSSYANYTDDNGIIESDPFNYNPVVQCSYDPNDKLVQPSNPGGYALLEGELIYTIRFQNTGNAEAYNVTIKDTLSEYLDPASFRVISSSHESVLSTSMLEEKYLNFFFHHIFLPDSSSNFEGSQGYVQYSIRPYAGLPELTQILNTAGIYFDSNPAVITNTTENTLVTSFDADEDG